MTNSSGVKNIDEENPADVTRTVKLHLREVVNKASMKSV